MSATFSYTLPDMSNTQFTNDTVVNGLLTDIENTDISNTTHATLERSNTLKNSTKIESVKNLATFLQELETLHP
jgi:hypothetical protein